MVKQATIAKNQRAFDPHAFLSTIGKGREMLSFENKKTIFAQGDPSEGLFFIQTGKVRISVVSEAGKEATRAILGERDFLEKAVLLVSFYACHPQLQSPTASFCMSRKRR